jgi:hypothetical protein
MVNGKIGLISTTQNLNKIQLFARRSKISDFFVPAGRKSGLIPAKNVSR